MSDSKKGFGPHLGTSILISLGFLTMGLMDPLYDTYLPLFLNRYIDSWFLISVIMTLDNIFALFLIPVVSVWSDNARTRIGRRMPFILVTLPLSAVFFAMIPYAAFTSLAALVLVVFFLNAVKQSARGPIVALMPDIIPGEYRSEANGIINMSSAIAAIVGTLFLARLMDLDIVLPILGTTKDRIPFVIAALLVVVAVILLFLAVKEKRSDESSAEARVPLRESLKAIAGAEDRSALLILVSILFWFLGYQGVLPQISSYMKVIIGVSTGQAALASGAVAISMTIFAVPSGYLAHRFGRKRTIRVALVALAAICVAAFLHQPLALALGLGKSAQLYSFLAIMFCFGTCWISVVANSFPMLWQMATYGNMGVYTGLYYTFSQAAAIASPPLTGLIRDYIGLRWIFVFAAVCMMIAWRVMGGVRRGEAAHDTAV